MKVHLTERAVKSIESDPGGRNIIVFDDEVAGFGARVTPAGARGFVLSYRAAGRKRCITIGSWPDWSVTAAREKAKELKREIDSGGDPLGRRIDAREAPTVSDLIEHYLNEHTVALAERSRSDQTSILRKMVESEWGRAR